MPFSADRLFRRYRENGDPRLLGRVFDRTASELLRVALHLTRDRHRAEDVLQTTFLTAIEKAQRYDPGRPLLPWLLAILANHARELHRRERRRAADAAAVAPVAGATSGDFADTAAAAELARACDQALDALPEPYRPVLILHLRHGLSGQEIAATLGHPDSTVRNQIARGLDLLRRKLPAGIAGAVAFGVASRSALASVRASVLARAPVPAAGTAAVGILGTMGAMVMMKAVLSAIGLLVVVGAGAWAAGWFASAPAVAPPDVPPLAGAEPTRTEPGGSVGDAVTAGEIASPVRVAAGASGGELQVVVVVAEQDKVVAAAACSIWTRNAGQRAQLVGEARTGDDGSVAFAALAPGPYLFVVDAPEHREELAIEAGAVTRLRCEIDAGVRCSGIVVDRDGRPVAGAAVHRACDWFSVVVARSAADGSFAMDHLRRGSGQVWAVQSGRQPSRRHDLDGRTDTSGVRLVLGELGTRLGGRVVDEQGRPAPNARVYVGFELPIGSTTFRQYERHDVRTDAAGAFALDWARPGHTVVAAVPADHDLERASFRELDLVAGEPAAVQLQLGDGASVAGVVRGEQGEPLAAIAVDSSDNDHGLAPLDRRFGASGPDGSFALRGLMPGKQWLSAQRAGGKGMRVDTNFELRAGQQADWNPVLGEGAPIAVHVVDPDGEPVARRHLSVAVGGEISAYGHTDEAGRYRFVHMPPVEHQLRVYGAEYGVVLAERAVVPGAAEIEIRLDAAQVPSARLSGRIVDAAGRPVADAEVTLNANSGFVQPQHPDRDGRFRTELLPPGRYGISARARSQGLGHAFRGVALAAKAEHDLGDLVLPATASLAVRLRGPDGGAVPDAMLRLGHRRETASGTDFLAADEVDGVYRKAGIDPGPDYVLRLHAPGVVPQCLPLALAAGERRELDVVAERGVTVTLELRCALAHPQGRGNLNAQVDVFDGAGERVACVRLWPYFDDFDQRLERVRLGLRPGKYRVHAEAFGARKTEVAIEVPATAPGQPFVIDLR